MRWEQRYDDDGPIGDDRDDDTEPDVEPDDGEDGYDDGRLEYLNWIV